MLIPRQLQSSIGLDTRAAADPDDDSKVSYMVAGFHQLHCLVSSKPSFHVALLNKARILCETRSIF